MLRQLRKRDGAMWDEVRDALQAAQSEANKTGLVAERHHFQLWIAWDGHVARRGTHAPVVDWMADLVPPTIQGVDTETLGENEAGCETNHDGQGGSADTEAAEQHGEAIRKRVWESRCGPAAVLPRQGPFPGGGADCAWSDAGAISAGRGRPAGHAGGERGESTAVCSEADRAAR